MVSTLYQRCYKRLVGEPTVSDRDAQNAVGIGSLAS